MNRFVQHSIGHDKVNLVTVLSINQKFAFLGMAEYTRARTRALVGPTVQARIVKI